MTSKFPDKTAFFYIICTQEHVGHVAALQPALESAGLGGHCHMAVEYARAMRDATKVCLITWIEA